MQIVIESDGTRKGTKVLVDGTEVKSLTSAWLSVDSWDTNISFSYTTKEEDKEANVRVSKTYTFDPNLAEASLEPFQVKAEEKELLLEQGSFDDMGERS